MRWFKRLFTRPGADEDLANELAAWRIISLENEPAGKFAVLRLRVVRPRSAVESFATAVELSWKYGGGLPPADVNEKQLAFERALDELAGDNGFSELVQVATGIGAKEWLFYTSNRARFMAEYNRLLENHERYPVEVSMLDDPEWEVWRNSVEAVRQRIA